MLISYPILSAHIGAAADEDDRLQRMLGHELLLEGTYPVSHDGRWHGGVHLDTRGEPVRAIADATVECFRVPSRSEEYPGQGPYDTGFVLLKHQTETGDATPVVFYSLYMHLRPLAELAPTEQAALPAFLREAATDAVIRGHSLPAAQQRIWRKDVLGYGGRLYQGCNRCHFEIYTTDDHLNGFWRDSSAVAAGALGHADWYGDTYYKIPAGRAFVVRPPGALTAAQQAYFPQLEDGSNAAELLVRIRLHRGDQYVKVWEKQATGAWRLLTADAGHRNPEYEYNLYQRATALYPSCPSAGFELLRGGRIDGPDVNILARTERHNWQAVHFAEGRRGYIDLNLPEHRITVLSDADFPAELGWRKVEEGQAVASDGIADVEQVAQLLQKADLNQDGSTTREEVQAYLTSRAGQSFRIAMRYWVAKHFSEWDSRTLEQRYRREREPGGALHEESAWQSFREHAEKLCFQDRGGFNPVPLWHFHPLQFIRQMRKCCWFSADELARVYPNKKYPVTALATEGRGRTPESIREQYRRSINMVKRKYSVNTPARMSHFYGQGAVESLFLVQMIEGSASFSRNPSHASFQPEVNGYYRPTNPNDYLNYLEGKLGNIERGDGPKFRGRGMKQLTGRENYCKYWVYRGWLDPKSFTSPWWSPARPERAPAITDPQMVSVDAYSAIDAGGWYWQAGSSKNSFRSINTVITTDSINRQSVRAVPIAINGMNRDGDPNSLTERTRETEAVSLIIMDSL